MDTRAADAVPDKFPIPFLRSSAARAELRQYPVGGERRMRFGGAGGAAVAAPFPPAGMFDRPGPDRVQDDVAADLQQIALLVDQDRLVAPLEDVPHAPVSSIVGLGVDTVQLAHAYREVAVEGLH